MKRREAIKISAGTLTFATATSFMGGLLSGCKADTTDHWSPSSLTPDQFKLISELSETIVPKTKTPGAKDAYVDRYIDEAVGNYFTEEDIALFMDNIKFIDDTAIIKFKKTFVQLKPEQRDELLSSIAKKAGNDPDHPFIQLRTLIVYAFFTSEIGCTEVLYYDPVPGPYKGCIALSEVGNANAANY